MAGQVCQEWLFLAVVYFAQAAAVRVITRKKKKVLKSLYKLFHLLSEFCTPVWPREVEKGAQTGTSGQGAGWVPALLVRDTVSLWAR